MSVKAISCTGIKSVPLKVEGDTAFRLLPVLKCGALHTALFEKALLIAANGKPPSFASLFA